MNIFTDYETFKTTMSKEEIYLWFQKRLNRTPEAFDVYQVAKDFYQLGSFSRALVCLQQYVLLPGATIIGRHLLGYCYLNLGETERALKEFKRCIKEGYHDDWQLVVELTIETEQKRRINFKEEQGAPTKAQ
ncbi:hypothetical protein HK103_002266 [Boothiomyces macroporosus]|uniref:Tetratricopeptide repeat protein n=1 Tax=Boothiomyces macroporosus TaxID=261099 RepID=A0AAD5U9L7_9FUNG|nr:hypothetical protein HK103_002266 [Boothiomyces macroporosus]